jgi:hypothetical protein
VLCKMCTHWRTEGEFWVVQTPFPRNSEVLTKMNRIPSSVENTSEMTNKLVAINCCLKHQKLRKFHYMKRNFLYKLQLPPELLPMGLPKLITVVSVLCPQLNLLNPPQKNSWRRHCLYVLLFYVHVTVHRNKFLYNKTNWMY